tara:strand:- start:66 stop:365 length:300 start_codon:yes stop_codon:yes gene_type:complete
MIKPILADAVRELVGGAISGGETFESIIYHDGQTPPTKKQAEDKLEKLQAEYDAQEYARKREAEFPSIQDLVVALYDTDDKADIEAKRAEVKKKYPKPE